MSEVIAFVSGPGGTGKTTCCAGIAMALAARGEKVLCIDLDIGLGGLDQALGMAEMASLSVLDVSEGGHPLQKAERHPEHAMLQLLTAPLNCRPDQLSGEAFEKLMEKARKHYDFVFLDAPAGLDHGFRLATREADRCLLVTVAEPAALRGSCRTAQQLQLMGKPARLVVDRIRPKQARLLGLTVDDVMDQVGLPLLGIVAEDENIPLAVRHGLSVTELCKKKGAAAAFDRMAQRIQGLPVGIPLKEFK